MRHTVATILLVASTAVTGMVSGALGCGPSEAHSANPMRPIDEGRAVRIIAQALSDDGQQGTVPRTMTLAGGTSVTLDVPVSRRRIGIIYLTDSDVLALGNDRLATRPETSELTVRQGDGPDAGMHVVILYASDYAYDDNAGTDRNATSITAERKLTRDVRDFLIIARKNHW